jgi:hypothetical protein
MGFQLIFAVWSAGEPEGVAVEGWEAQHGDLIIAQLRDR